MNKFLHQDYYIYQHIDTDTNEVRYYGKGRATRAYRTSTRSVYWNRVFNKNNLKVEILVSNLTEHEAFILEKSYIATGKELGYRLVNLTAGGEGNSKPEQVTKNKLEILRFYLLNGRLPSRVAKDFEEIRLHSKMRSYISESQGPYDPEFLNLIRPLMPGVGDPEAREQEIFDFYKKNNRLPSKANPSEKRLADDMRRYSASNNSGYREAFKNWRDSLPRTIKHSSLMKQQIKNFFKVHHRLPSESIPAELQMNRAMRDYMRNRTGRDPKFIEWARPKMKTNKHLIVKDQIKSFYASFGRLPVKSILSERKLATALQYYMQVKRVNSYDPDFREWFLSVSTRKSKT